jgi:SM-20-related protein
LSLVFEQIIDSFLETEIGQSLDFLSTDLAEKLKSNILNLNKANQLSQAGIGVNTELHTDILYRNDKIHWLESKSENEAEIDFFKLMDAFVIFLNQTCYTGITNYEFHYTVYEPESFYKRHVDQFKSNDNRVFSIILYLNENWKEGDGGELAIYKNEIVEKIEPLNGRMIFFDSAKLAHEVLVTNVPRYSITGWLRRD